MEWDILDGDRLAWDDQKWRNWTYIETTQEDFKAGSLYTLITQPHGALSLPDQFGIAMGPGEIGDTDQDNWNHLWVTYRADDGDIWLARANDTYDDWEHLEKISFVPSGSTNPTVTFDENGYYVIAMEYLPAGATQKEIWMIDYPYNFNNVNKTADGQHPVLASDIDGVVYLFYQAVDTQVIEYRTSADHYTAVSELAFAHETQPLGFRTHHTEVSPYHDKYIYLLFFSTDDLPGYWRSADVDRYTVGIDMQVVDTNGAPIPNAIVYFNEETKTTDANGEVTFMKVPWGVTLHYTINGHPKQTLIPEANKGTHIGLIVTDQPFNETMEPVPSLSMILWQGTEFDEEHPTETMSPTPTMDDASFGDHFDTTFTVYQPNGEPLAGATFTYDGATYTSDANGQIIVPQLYIPHGPREYEISHPDHGTVTGLLDVDYKKAGMLEDTNEGTSLSWTNSTFKVRSVQDQMVILRTPYDYTASVNIINTTGTQQTSSERIETVNDKSISITYRPHTRCSVCNLSTCNQDEHSPNYTMREMRSAVAGLLGTWGTGHVVSLTAGQTVIKPESFTVRYNQQADFTTSVGGDLRISAAKYKAPAVVMRQSVIPLNDLYMDGVYLNARTMAELRAVNGTPYGGFAIEIRTGTGTTSEILHTVTIPVHRYNEDRTIQYPMSSDDGYLGLTYFDFDLPSTMILEKGVQYWVVIKSYVSFLNSFAMRGTQSTRSEDDVIPYNDGVGTIPSWQGHFWKSYDVPTVQYQFLSASGSLVETPFERYGDKDNQLMCLGFGLRRVKPDTAKIPIQAGLETMPYKKEETILPTPTVGISWQEIFYVTQEHEETIEPAPAINSILWVEV